MTVEIKGCNGAVLFAAETSDIRSAVEAAVRANADLGGANLARANLARAYLARAYLGGANLAGADLARANLVGADLARADLGGANLAGADLGGANLAGADLARANLVGAVIDGDRKLVGPRPILQVGPLGSRYAYLVAYLTDAGPMVRAGCWFGSLSAFGVRVAQEHGDSVHGIEYAAAIEMIRAHAAQWSPSAEHSMSSRRCDRG